MTERGTRRSASGRTRAITVGIAVLLVGGSAFGAWRVLRDSTDPHMVGSKVRILVDPVPVQNVRPGDRDRDRELGRSRYQLRLYQPDRCLVMHRDADPKQPRDPIIRQPVTDADLAVVPFPWESAVWPYGTTVVPDGDTHAVRLADGKTFRIGEIVTGGAGVFPTDNTTPRYGLPRACTGGHGVVLFDPIT